MHTIIGISFSLVVNITLHCIAQIANHSHALSVPSSIALTHPVINSASSNLCGDMNRFAAHCSHWVHVSGSLFWAISFEKLLHSLKDLDLQISSQILFEFYFQRNLRKVSFFLGSVIFMTKNRVVISDHCPQTGSKQFKLLLQITKFGLLVTTFSRF